MYKEMGVAGLVLVTLGVMFVTGRRQIFLPARTSDGHHLLEAACSSCHVPFTGIPNEKCIACHRAELAEDTHPMRMFDDPRWAATLETIDVLSCITCHREHRVVARSLTISREFCFPCHDDVVVKRANHRTFPASSCGSPGCHNYHDNTALNTAFLKKHFHEPEKHTPHGLPQWGRAVPSGAQPVPPKYPESLSVTPETVARWKRSIHALKKVNCMDCHTGAGGAFYRRPDEASCKRCHRFEVESFHGGKHGARRALNLTPLRPEDARLPMKAVGNNRPKQVGCGTCHDPHTVDTRPAAVDACLSCHDVLHSRSFGGSKHSATLRASTEGLRHGPQAVTCATCHLPRMKVEEEKRPRVAVNHNNTFSLRPRDRMVKMVCLTCHGLELAMTSIMDAQLVRNNFKGRPRQRLETFLMIEALLADKRKSGEMR